jgi:hypothetical protein
MFAVVRFFGSILRCFVSVFEHVCQEETILYEGMEIIFENEINVLNLRFVKPGSIRTNPCGMTPVYESTDFFPRIRIRDSESGAFLSHESGMGKNSGSGIRAEQSGSYFREFRNNFLG